MNAPSFDADPDRPQPTSEEWLRHGHALEAEGAYRDALAAYTRSIMEAGSDIRQKALGWMNRGNALQKIGAVYVHGGDRRDGMLLDAVRAYDEAIALFKTLPVDVDAAACNHLGAAWLNRGHAQMMIGDHEGAEAALGCAIAQLERLQTLDAAEHSPSDTRHHRLNLAGAWTNLAHVRLGRSPHQARDAARAALGVLGGDPDGHEHSVAMSLRARRALIMALGELLVEAERDGQAVNELADEATDAVDHGLALAATFEAGEGGSWLRPLAERLFRLGAELYRRHQPQFLGEFLIENVSCPLFAGDAVFLEIAKDALTRASEDLQHPQVLTEGHPRTERLLDIAAALRRARQQIDALSPHTMPASAKDTGGSTPGI